MSVLDRRDDCHAAKCIGALRAMEEGSIYTMQTRLALYINLLFL